MQGSEIYSWRAGETEVAAWAKVSQPRKIPPLSLRCAGAEPSSCQRNVDGNGWTNNGEMCLSVARRINKGSRFIFQEPRSSLKAVSQLRNETPEIAQEQKYFVLMQTVGS